MSIRPDHGSDRNGSGKPSVAARQPRATASQTPVPQTGEPTPERHPDGAILQEKGEPAGSEPATERRHAVTQLNLTSAEDLCRLRDLLAPEYDTLAARRDQLLHSASGQYVLIHREEVRVYPDLDSALEEAHTHYPHDLFFVGRVHEQDFREYLATRGT